MFGVRSREVKRRLIVILLKWWFRHPWPRRGFHYPLLAGHAPKRQGGAPQPLLDHQSRFDGQDRIILNKPAWRYGSFPSRKVY